MGESSSLTAFFRFSSQSHEKVFLTQEHHAELVSGPAYKR